MEPPYIIGIGGARGHTNPPLMLLSHHKASITHTPALCIEVNTMHGNFTKFSSVYGGSS
jgi:hypothetical protein